MMSTCVHVVVSRLCICGLCKYVLQDEADLLDEWLLEHVVFNISSIFSSAVSLMFVLSILWAVYDDNSSALVSPHIFQGIKEV
eukprot:2666919-Ditylum_brightwellii.AAC.1